MDNRIFNVNGRGTEMLTDTLKLAFTQWGKNAHCVSWKFNKDKGLILKWHAEGENCMGWRVYCEDWGHVDDSFYAICAVRPVYLWYGK